MAPARAVIPTLILPPSKAVRGCGCAQDSVPAAQHNFAIGADIEQRVRGGLLVEARGNDAGQEVAAHEAAETGEETDVGAQPSSRAVKAAGGQVGGEEWDRRQRGDAEAAEEWCMVVLPTISTSSRARPAARRANIWPRVRRIMAVNSPGRRRSYWMRLMTSAPCRAWGLSAVSTASTSPVERSTSCAASVVVPQVDGRAEALARFEGRRLFIGEHGSDHWSTSTTTLSRASAQQARRQPWASSASDKACRMVAVMGMCRKGRGSCTRHRRSRRRKGTRRPARTGRSARLRCGSGGWSCGAGTPACRVETHLDMRGASTRVSTRQA